MEPALTRQGLDYCSLRADSHPCLDPFYDTTAVASVITSGPGDSNSWWPGIRTQTT